MPIDEFHAQLPLQRLINPLLGGETLLHQNFTQLFAGDLFLDFQSLGQLLGSDLFIGDEDLAKLFVNHSLFSYGGTKHNCPLWAAAKICYKYHYYTKAPLKLQDESR